VVGHFLRMVVRGACVRTSPNLWRGHRAIIAALQVCFRARIICCIFKAGGSCFVEWKPHRISHFEPMWKLGERWPIVELYLRPHPKKYIWWSSTALLHVERRLIKKKRVHVYSLRSSNLTFGLPSNYKTITIKPGNCECIATWGRQSVSAADT